MECGMPNSEFGKQKTSVEQMAEVRKEEEQVRDLALIGIVQKWDKEKIPKCLDYFFLSNSPLSAFHTQYSSIPIFQHSKWLVEAKGRKKQCNSRKL